MGTLEALSLAMGTAWTSGINLYATVAALGIAGRAEMIKLPPEERSPRGYTSDRVLIDACRPYKWMDQFPPVNAFTKEFKDKIAGKWKL